LAPPCPGDLDGDGTIGGGDLAVLLAGWGGSSPDLDGDGVVGGSDLAVLLSSWGEPCGS
ncbi:MAG: Dockerin type domain, partial [Planctomycetota bacterium]